MKNVTAFNGHVIVTNCKQVSGGRPITQSADIESGIIRSSCSSVGTMTPLLPKGTKIIFHNGNKFTVGNTTYYGVSTKDILATISK